MKHRRKNRKFGRTTKQRSALLKSLAVALIKSEKIKTTEAKAKDLRPYVERLITRGKRNSQDAIRRLNAILDKKSTMKVVKELGPRFLNRRGGYTRIRKLPPRKSDSAKMAIIEFVNEPESGQNNP